MGFLEGKKALIVGLASNRSIAWGIAQAMKREGAELAFTYLNDKLKPRVEKMAAELGSSIVLPLDVSSDDQINALPDGLKAHWDGLDIIIHSVAFAPSEMLEGDFMENITREGFSVAHDISSYSFTAIAKVLLPLMEGRQAALLTLSYLGANRVLPGYNVMGLAKASLEANVRYMASSLGPRGIRVNAVSAGPIRTLAASGIKNFRAMLNYNQQNTPTRRNVTIEEVGNVSAFLCSDLASGVNGEITYVDGGYNIVGMGQLKDD